MGEIDPTLGMVLWNGLFVTKDTPQDVRDKIIASAQKTVNSERAQKVAADTGASIYWEDAATAAEHIKSDISTMAEINAKLN